MSPTSFHHDHHAKPCTTNVNNHGNNGSLLPPCLKVNKESHISKHVSPPPSFSLPSPPSSSSSSSPPTRMGPAKPPPQQQQQRHHPVIIYTHSPKIIHTHPKDFMALVQKLTGLSQAEDDRSPSPSINKQERPSPKEATVEEKSTKVNDDHESSSVITEENCGSNNNNSTTTTTNNNNNVLGDGQVNSCFVPPMFDPPNPYMTNIPGFAPNSTSADFLCTNHHQPFFGYTDSLLFGTPNNLRSPIPSASALEGISDFRDL